LSCIDQSGSPISEDPTRGDLACIVYRHATEIDADSIAVLHADSWRRHYRGALLDSFLDGDVLPERIEVWRQRLRQPHKASITMVADTGNAIVGFVHMIIDEDPIWGTLLDNLHVASHLKRNGIGRRLMQSGVENLLQRGRQTFHLWVLDQNVAAQNFYLSQGSRYVETCLRGPLPGGSYALGRRIVWDDASVLANFKREP
jgi:ribosomal protein S18 acetylase RimI-like enzyme